MYPDLRAAGAEVVGPVAPEFPRRPAAALPCASPGGVGGDRPFRRCPPHRHRGAGGSGERAGGAEAGASRSPVSLAREQRAGRAVPLRATGLAERARLGPSRSGEPDPAGRRGWERGRCSTPAQRQTLGAEGAGGASGQGGRCGETGTCPLTVPARALGRRRGLEPRGERRAARHGARAGGGLWRDPRAQVTRSTWTLCGRIQVGIG